MPSGRTHDRLAWLSTLPLVATMAAWWRWDLALAAGAGALFGGLYFSGDLDTVSRPLRRWGFLAWLWWPYRKLVPHRGVHSHGLVWGPFFRLAYLTALVSVLLAAIAWGLRHWVGQATSSQLGTAVGLAANQLAGIDPWLMAAGIGGLFYGNAVHSLADWSVSGAKVVGRRARRRAHAGKASAKRP